MHLTRTALAGVAVADTSVFQDNRGAFMRLFCRRELAEANGQRTICQVNFSRTERAGSIRGLHFQHPPHAEGKWVRCLRGRVLDVAVDLRAGSPTFLKWHGEELSAENRKMLFIPEGCAHGFQTLEDGTELLYLHTEFYAPSAEAGVRFDDPRLGIRWPLPVADMSEKDRSLPLLPPDFEGIRT